MLIAIIFLIITLALCIFLFFIQKRNKKVFVISLAIVCLIFTSLICIEKPTLHKFMSISVIDYILKFNTDGSMTTTKKTTTTNYNTVKGDSNE